MLKSNIKQAAGRTRKVQADMITSPALGKAICDAHQTFIERDSVEVVDTSIAPVGPVYYMPYRAIRKADSKTTECRLVMDASAKPSASDVSLNQVLYQGQNLVLNLAILLLRFMKGKYGTVADLEKAFLRICIAAVDRDVLRYFWFSDPNDINSPLITMRFKVVIFGSTASPFQLAAVIHCLIRDDCRDTYVKNILNNCIYVDNVVYAEDSEQNLVRFYRESRETFRKGDFNLRQWGSNSKQVQQIATRDGVLEEDTTIKVLGMYWDIDTDRYLYNTAVAWDGKFTKRSALAFVCKVFDPLGILAPITTRGKVFLQELWRCDIKWDDSFEFLQEGKLTSIWLQHVKNIQEAIKCNFARNVVTDNRYEIHVFSDASQDSYGAVTYVKTLPCKDYPQGHIRLAMAKGKVAPLKGNRSIPKLELAAVVVAAHQAMFVKEAWNSPENTKYFLWIDAKVVLRWLGQYNIKETYVHNRVKQIRECMPKEHTTIKYVPTDCNNADLITKEQKVEEFMKNSEWFHGPKFLLKSQDWPETEERYTLFPEEIPEIISNFHLSIKISEENPF